MTLITKNELAAKCGVHESTVRRAAGELDISAVKKRTPASRGQKVTVFSEEDADAICAYLTDGSGLSEKPKTTKQGRIYLLQPAPLEAPNRIKIGFSTALCRRFTEHRQTSATCRIFASWPAKPTWENACQDWLQQCAVTTVGEEEILVSDLETLRHVAQTFFDGMPAIVDEEIGEDESV